VPDSKLCDNPKFPRFTDATTHAGMVPVSKLLSTRNSCRFVKLNHSQGIVPLKRFALRNT
jgi:hypothetical protein